MTTTVRIPIPKDRVAEFCRRYRIRELSLFGSVLRDDFHPESDVDALVEFQPDAKHSLFDLVQIAEDLTSLFGREVHLVEKPALRNPFRRYEILRTRQVIFAA